MSVYLKIIRKCVIVCVRCDYNLSFLSFHSLVFNPLLLKVHGATFLTDKYIKSRILQSQVKPLIWLWIHI